MTNQEKTKSKNFTVPGIRSMKGRQAISVLTAYDYPSAKLIDQAGIHMILVGDSLGNVLYGYKNTLPVKTEDVVRHTSAVSRAVKRSLVVADMPFLSYHESSAQAVRNAGRLVQEGGAGAVKCEGGRSFRKIIKKIVRAGIPVMGHIGLTPQRIHEMGSYKKHGERQKEKKRLLKDAQALEEAGCFALVLECIEESLAREISEKLKIPSIGIGSGQACDGQVLVLHDLLGLSPEPSPKFVRPTRALHKEITRGVQEYIQRTQSEWIQHYFLRKPSVQKPPVKPPVKPTSRPTFEPGPPKARKILDPDKDHSTSKPSRSSKSPEEDPPSLF